MDEDFHGHKFSLRFMSVHSKLTWKCVLVNMGLILLHFLLIEIRTNWPIYTAHLMKFKIIKF